jgi:hypothetical protein
MTVALAVEASVDAVMRVAATKKRVEFRAARIVDLRSMKFIGVLRRIASTG